MGNDEKHPSLSFPTVLRAEVCHKLVDLLISHACRFQVAAGSGKKIGISEVDAFLRPDYMAEHAVQPLLLDDLEPLSIAGRIDMV